MKLKCKLICLRAVVHRRNSCSRIQNPSWWKRTWRYNSICGQFVHFWASLPRHNLMHFHANSGCCVLRDVLENTQVWTKVYKSGSRRCVLSIRGDVGFLPATKIIHLPRSAEDRKQLYALLPETDLTPSRWQTTHVVDLAFGWSLDDLRSPYLARVCCPGWKVFSATRYSMKCTLGV